MGGRESFSVEKRFKNIKSKIQEHPKKSWGKNR